MNGVGFSGAFNGVRLSMNYSPELNRVYERAWGRQWTHHDGIILKTDIGIPPDRERTDADGIAVDIPDRWDYTCLDDIESIAIAFGITAEITNFLLLRSEYDLLREYIEKSTARTRAFVITGQPGIGKTVFLIYLLLYRLERKLPTAVQFGGHCYFLFDGEGASRHPLGGPVDSRLSSCWALADSNSYVVQPCVEFVSRAKIVIQASSLQPKRWKGWLKQKRGERIYAELPTVLEIAALLKELHSVSFSAFPLVTKWGPSVRTIIDISSAIAQGPEEAQDMERDLQAEAHQAAHKICSDTSFVSLQLVGEGGPDSFGSTVGFVRPHRRITPSGKIAASSRAIWFIPTTFLDEIFTQHCTNFSNEKSRELFIALSSHSLTRTVAEWKYEKDVHRRLSTAGAPPLTIFNHDRNMPMRPSAELVPGTVDGLKHTSASKAFYWMPSVMTWEGIDGILGDTDNNLYAVQATIASEYSSPMKGLEQAWLAVDSSARASRRWHLVIVGADVGVVEELVKELSGQLESFKLGRSHEGRVEVWGCILE